MACFKWIKGRSKPARSIKLVIVGLDDAGKTTTVACLSGEPPDGITPTIGFSNTSITIGKWDLTIYDLGGGSGVRSVWESYYAEIYGIIFTVDSGDIDRIDESKDVLAEIFKNPKVNGKPVVVLANKQDKEDSLTEKQIAEQLELQKLSEKFKFTFNVFPCSALKGYGKQIDKSIQLALDWLLEAIDKDYSVIHEKVESESAVQRELEAAERKARMERIKKLREEREKAAKEAGVEEEDEESDNDVVTGNPFRNINDQIGVTEKREKRAKEKMKKIKAHQQQQAENEEIDNESPKKKRRRKKKKKRLDSTGDDGDVSTIPQINIQSPTPRPEHIKTKKKITHDNHSNDEDDLELSEIKTHKKKKRTLYYDEEEDNEDDLSENLKNININKERKKNKNNTTENNSQIILVSSLDNVREDDSPPQVIKKKKKKRAGSYSKHPINDNISDVDPMNISTVRELPDIKKKKKRADSYSEHPINDNISDVDPFNISTVGELPDIKKKKKHYYDDENMKHAERTKSDQEIKDSRTELFLARSSESLQGNTNEYVEKKVRKKKKKKKKIIVVLEEDDEEYEERTITKKKKKTKNRTTVVPTSSHMYDDVQEGSPLKENGHVSKLEPIRLRGRLPDIGKIESSSVPSWARAKLSSDHDAVAQI